MVLLDEIEKAHPDVFNALLQVLDDGRLTDGQGRTVDFKNTVLIMTSNVGSQYVAQLSERGEDAVREGITEALRAHFRPEFLNRIDETIIFHSLSREHLRSIVDLQVRLLAKRVRAQSHVELKLTDAALDWLGEQGFDPQFGARPLKRVIQRSLENALAMALLDRRVREHDTVTVDVDRAADGGAKLTFRTASRRNGASNGNGATHDDGPDFDGQVVEDAEYEELE